MRDMSDSREPYTTPSETPDAPVANRGGSQSTSALTAEHLVRLRVLLEKATPGPWVAMSRNVGTPSDSDWDDYFLGWEIEGSEGESNGPPQPTRGQFIKAADAQLIAESRNVLLALLDRLDRFQNIVNEYSNHDARCDAHPDWGPPFGPCCCGYEAACIAAGMQP